MSIAHPNIGETCLGEMFAGKEHRKLTLCSKNVVLITDLVHLLDLQWDFEHSTIRNVVTSRICNIIHVINFKDASGRFFFHFLEVFEKMYGLYKNFLH